MLTSFFSQIFTGSSSVAGGSCIVCAPGTYVSATDDCAAQQVNIPQSPLPFVPIVWLVKHWKTRLLQLLHTTPKETVLCVLLENITVLLDRLLLNFVHHAEIAKFRALIDRIA